MKYLVRFCLFLITGSLSAQVEIFRNTQDTSTYIAPGDTITKAPVFETGDHDFFRYIETRYNLRNNQSLGFAGEVVRFSFYVGKDGDVEDYKHISASDVIVASEVERIVSDMPKWNPGYFQGKKKKTLMVYDLLIKQVNDFPPVQVVKNESTAEYTDQTKEIKWFIVAGSVLVLATLWITSFIRD